MIPGFRRIEAISRKERRLVVLGGIISLVVAVWLLSRPVLAWVGDNLIVKDRLARADIIHVIAGLDHRTDYGIRLYKEGYGKLIFFTGGWCTDQHHFHGLYGRERALQQGVPTEAIAIDDTTVTSTYSEAVRLREFIAHSALPVRAVIVVSDPYHMRRATWTYREVLGPGIGVLMAPVPFEMTPYDRRWWTSRESRSMVEDEYLKILYYHARYGMDWPFLTGWLASLDRE